MHWYIVANKEQAKFFVETEDIERVRKIDTLENPLAHESKKSLIRKEAGRQVKSIGRVASVNYSHPKRTDPEDQATLQFAKQLSERLLSSLQKKDFESLTIVAEPKFLGLLKKEMDPRVRSVVSDWIHKDLMKTPQTSLAQSILRHH